MSMKKVIILAGLLLVMAHAAFAEQRGVLMEIHNKSIPEKNMSVNRAPMRLPIEVVYDTDTHRIEVVGSESLIAEIFLYKADGTLVDHSSIINTTYTVQTSATYIILIQGDEWYVKGEIET